jgi:hypothetical protein
MKNVDETRFQKKKSESIAFQGKVLPESAPPPQAPASSGSVRPNGRTDEHSPTASADLPAYVVRIPADRRKTRHPFDIFEDQLEGLRKIQLAERENSKPRKGKTLGEMTQEALDHFIAEKAKRLSNVDLRHEDA